MATIKKYTDENGAGSNAVLTNGEQHMTRLMATGPKKYTIWEFVQMMMDGTWEGGYVSGLGYIGADMFTEVESEDSSVTIFRPTDSSWIFPDMDSSGFSDLGLPSSFIMPSGNLSDLSGSNLINVTPNQNEIMLHRIEKFSFDWPLEQIFIEGYCTASNTIVMVSLTISASWAHPMTNEAMDVYISVPYTTQEKRLGTILPHINLAENPITFTGALSLIPGCNTVEMFFTHYSSYTKIGSPQPIVIIRNTPDNQ